jgi:hypothetical protein
MVGKLSLLLTMLFACAGIASAQAFTYSYVDPCDGKRKYVSVNEPSGSITMSYNTFIKTFKVEDFTSGAFEQWIEQIKNSIPSTNPCGGVGVTTTTNTNTQIAVNTVAVVTNVVTTVASSVISAGPSPADIVSGGGGGVGVDGIDAGGESGGTDVESDDGGSGGGNGEKDKEKGGKKDKKKETKKEGDGSGGGGTGDGSGGGTGDGGGSGGGDGSGKTEGETTQKSDGNKDGKSEGGNGEVSGDGEGGGGMDIKAAGNSSSKQKSASLAKGNLIATGDVVGIQNQTTDNNQAFRINASLTYADSKKIWVYGGLLNFTTTINNSSFTGFLSYRWKKLTTILANSTMVNFEKDIFNTTTIMASYPVWKLGTMAGVNVTTGMLGSSGFQSLSALAGINGSIPIMKNLTTNIMLVGLYSPYTFYYEGMWYKTNIIAVPFVGFDYGITKTFKFNASFTGVYEVRNNVLNYQALVGGKFLF